MKGIIATLGRTAESGFFNYFLSREEAIDFINRQLHLELNVFKSNEANLSIKEIEVKHCKCGELMGIDDGNFCLRCEKIRADARDWDYSEGIDNEGVVA